MLLSIKFLSKLIESHFLVNILAKIAPGIFLLNNPKINFSVNKDANNLFEGTV